MDPQITDLFVLLALILAAIEQWDAKGRSAIAWAVIILCIVAFWHLLP